MLSPERALVDALAEIERYVSASGWDQPSRLFALVRTEELLAAEPTLAGQLTSGGPDALSSIEQDGFHSGEDLQGALAGISWPETVDGVALAVERSFLTTDHEAELPSDAEAAASYVAHHPDRRDIRIVAGALREGSVHALARLVAAPDDLLGGADLAPGLCQALLATLQEVP